MIAYLDRVNELLRDFNCEVKQIPREQNTRANALAQLAFSPEKDLLRSVPVVIIPEPSIIKCEEKEVATINHRSSWMDPIMGYLMNGTLPEDKNESKKVRYRATRYVIMDNQLYKRGYSLPLLKCLTPEDGDNVLREIILEDEHLPTKR